MNRAEWRLQGGEIVVWQRPSPGVAVLRWVLGLPIFASGLWFAWLLVAGPLSFLRAEGGAGLAAALPGMAVSLAMTALFLPLGGWMLLMRKRWRIDLARRVAVEETDWRLGRRARSNALEHFVALRLGVGRLDRGASTSSNALALLVELVPRDPARQAPLELAWFDPDAGEAARRCANALATHSGLPLDDLGDDHPQGRKRRR